MNKIDNFVIAIGETNYNVTITYKRIKSLIIRYRNNAFLVSAPTRVDFMALKAFVLKASPKLLAKESRLNSPIGDDYIYILGKRLSLVKGDTFRVNDDQIVIDGSNRLESYLKRLLHMVVSQLVKQYEEMMNIKPSYRISIKNMKTRYGSNSRMSHRLSFATSLVHYSIEIISSVVVHELVHDYVFDHSANFYREVYRYFPTYKEVQKRLKRGIFA